VALNEACPTSIAAGQIPRDQIMAILAPLVKEIKSLRADAAWLRADIANLQREVV
jgi:hypothetical protein